MQQLAALPANAPALATSSGGSPPQTALVQQLRQLQRRLQADQPSLAAGAAADLERSSSPAPDAKSPPGEPPAANGHAGTHPLIGNSGQAGDSGGSGPGSQLEARGQASSGQSLGSNGEPAQGHGAEALVDGQQGGAVLHVGQSGDAQAPSRPLPSSTLVESAHAAEEQQQPGERRPKAEPGWQQEQEEEARDEQGAVEYHHELSQQQQVLAAAPAQDPPEGYPVPPAAQPLGPLHSSFYDAPPSAPPPPQDACEANGASREVELLAAAAKALSAASAPPSGAGSHGRAAGGDQQAAGAAGDFLAGLTRLGPLSLSSLQGQPGGSAALDLASVPGGAQGVLVQCDCECVSPVLGLKGAGRGAA